MANRILVKRGRASNIGSVELQEGELAVAYSDDKSTADLYVGNGTGKAKVNLKGDKGDTGATGPQGPKGDKGDKGDTASITGGASTIATSNLTASRALVSNSSGKVAVSTITSTQLGYLSGVTSNIQTQLNSKFTNAAAGEQAFQANTFADEDGENSVTGRCSFISGYYNTVSGAASAVLGGVWNTVSGAYASVLSGDNNTASGGGSSVLGGSNNEALAFQTKLGNYSTTGTAGTYSGTTGDAFFIGNGSSSSRSNAFRVAYDGNAYAKKAMNSTGADYAEFFEWLDGNTDNTDRCGLFVTLDGDKIRIANSDDDYILGIVSGAPGVVGNNHADTWQGMWLTDIFGRVRTHTVHHDAVYKEFEVTDPETGEVTTEQVIIHEACDAEEPIVNPDYDQNEKYTPRENRPEWGIVGMMGQLVTIDDGTCKVNGYCKVADGGMATAADSGYRVIARLDDTHIKVLFR